MLKRSIRPFARWQKPTNDFLTPEFIKRQKDIVDQYHDERQQIYLKADRLALTKLNQEKQQDQSLWWNKIQNMTEEEEEFLPYSFVKKYGTFAKNILDNQ